MFFDGNLKREGFIPTCNGVFTPQLIQAFFMCS